LLLETPDENPAFLFVYDVLLRNMKSALAIMTFRRLPALAEMLKGISQHCAHYPLAIFEDMGQRDGTSAFLSQGRTPTPRPDLLATEMVMTPEAISTAMTDEEKLLGVTKTFPRVFLGTENLGVSGNSNRAIKWFMDETDADHLCLCNDDLHVLGDFVSFYGRGHTDLDIGMFCFCPSGGIYDHGSYRWVTVRSRGYAIRLMPRITGIMISITRKLIEKVGYFDTRFGKFGEEHCDYTYRARFAGGIRLDGVDQGCLDLEPAGWPETKLLQHQEVETSLTGGEREKANQEASVAMRAAAHRYHFEHYHRPFALKALKSVGTFPPHDGVPVSELSGYALAKPAV
jgi:GT2 family glycosyltransferase